MGFVPLFRLAYVIAYRRIAANWRLELAVALGILLAVALVAGGVIYSSVLEEAALQRTLSDGTADDVNLEVRYFYNMDPAFHRQAEDLIVREVQPRLEPYYGEQAQWVRTSTFYFEGYPQLELAQEVRPRGRLQYVTGFERQVRLVEGRFPLDAADLVEVAVDTSGIELLGLSVGDQFSLIPAAVGGEPQPLQAHIVGLLEILDRDDPFWYGASDALSYTGQRWDWISMFTTPQTVFHTLSLQYPGMYTEESWFFYLDGEALRTSQISGLQKTLDQLGSDIGFNLQNSSFSTRLDKILDEYKQQVTLARVPLLLLVLLSIAILMYYLFMVSFLIVRSRAEEIAVLKSRGATTLQVTLLMFVEGLVLAVPAIALGPFLALGIVSTLGEALSSSAPEIGLAPVALSPRAFLLGAAGGILSVIVSSFSALVTARHGVVHFRQAGARPPSVPFIHRYYLDIMLLVVIAFILWQVQENRSFLIRPLGESGLQIDYSLLLGPVLGFIAVGLLVLRFFPTLLRTIAKVAEPAKAVWLVQALRRVSRDPIMPGALVALVMLATTLGVVAGTFNSSLQGSQEDRAMYAAGAGVRVRYQAGKSTPPLYDPGDSLGFLPNVEAASLIYRQTASLATSSFGREITLMAVDTNSFPETAWYRSDLSSQSMNGMMEKIRPQQTLEKGLPLPADAAEFGVWVRPVRPDSRAFLVARLEDAEGQFFSAFLGRWEKTSTDESDETSEYEFLYSLDFRDWRYLSASMDLDASEADLPVDPSPPFTLGGLFVTYQWNTEAGALFIDDVTASTPTGEVMLDDFEQPLGWEALEDPSAPGLMSLDTTRSAFHSGVGSASLTWSSGGLGTGTRGIKAGPTSQPLPVLVSEEFLETAEAEIGDTVVARISGVSVPLQITAVENYFPTLFANEEMFAVVDLGSLLDYVNLRTTRSSLEPNELWATLPPNADSSAVTEPLQSRGVKVLDVAEASEIVESRLSHPLLATGWSGLLALSFIAVVLASASSVMLYSFMDAREHQTEFALLRAFGLSKGQLNGILWAALVLMILVAIAAGTGVGYVVSGQGLQVGPLDIPGLLPLMEVAEEGRRITPPMALHSDWWTLFWYYMVLGLAGVLTGTLLAWVVGRRQVHRVLRMGEQ
ncbi:MAG: FtsX-like permease family protein [Dehalococcoidia bacterium]